MAKDILDYEAIVVGAGAAGLAATHRLHNAGRQVLCLESADRIGGRCHTNTDIFGVPFDMGGHWLHYADLNSFIPIGQELGFDLYPAPKNYRHAGSDVAGTALMDEFGEIDARLYQPAEDAPDISMAEALEPQNDFERTSLLFKSLSSGRDLSEISVKAWHDGLEENNWFCKQGFGTIVARHAEGLPVKLNTPVTAITRTPDGVEIETPEGKITAVHVIVTVSVGILAAEVIRFDPPLEDTRRKALDGITMGTFNHAAMLFAPDTLPVEPDTWLSYDIAELRGDYAPGGGFLCNISGSGLTSMVHVGNFAKELEAAGEGAATAFALDRLVEIFGSDIKAGFKKGHTTRWGQNEHTRGAYSGTRPGAQGLHRDLRPVHAEVIHFAGEAMNEAERVCVSGAHKEGLRAAEEVLAAV
ncbi:MAG: NAD(P)/FAD-dependent oxidoreductase [Pseudomonadota bacterium]